MNRSPFIFLVYLLSISFVFSELSSKDLRKHSTGELLELKFDPPIKPSSGFRVYGLEKVSPAFEQKKRDSLEFQEEFTNEYVIDLKEGVEGSEVASKYGLKLLSCSKYNPRRCLFEQPKTVKRGEHEGIKRLREEPSLHNWIERQQITRFEKFQTETGGWEKNELWTYSWHLNNTFSGHYDEDVNILHAWNKGYSGVGVNIGIVDDGVQIDHPDLKDKYVSESSYDFNDRDSDPSPGKESDKHGTSVAGVAGASNNNLCSLGAGYNAYLSGLRLISGGVSDNTIAACLTYSELIDIYSNSWGYSVAFAKELSKTVESAFTEGVTFGRNQNGFIYTWAAGNSRTERSNVNYDSLANAPETIAVAAVAYNGRFSYYSNPGCALHISAPSNGDGKGIYTTDRTGRDGYSLTDCEDNFGGTSSACPLVSGVISLILEANKELGWRDVQHILARTARKNDPSNTDWRNNGAGFHVNHNYGFGVIDATEAVDLAKTWVNVPERQSLSQIGIIKNNQIPNDGSIWEHTWEITEDLVVEHVQVYINLYHSGIRTLSIELTSPDGTLSKLLDLAAPTTSTYLSWTFMTVFNWGENARGNWKLHVKDNVPNDRGVGQIQNVDIKIWGYQQPLQLRINYEEMCFTNGMITFSWKDDQINTLRIKRGDGTSAQGEGDYNVYGLTSFSISLSSGSWVAGLYKSSDPETPVSEDSFNLPDCSETFVLVEVIDCGMIEIVYNQAPSGSQIILQEVDDATKVTAISSPATSGKYQYIRPYYGSWQAKIVQGSTVVSTSEPFPGDLCKVPSLDVNTTQQCTDSKMITITATNTQPGMMIQAQSTNGDSPIFLKADQTLTDEPIVLSFQRPSPDGQWSARIMFYSHTIVEQGFEVSLCVDPTVAVDTSSSCTEGGGVSVSWKNAPKGSYVAIVRIGNIWVNGYAATETQSGTTTFDLNNGEYIAVIVSHSFELLAYSDTFEVHCQSSVSAPDLTVEEVHSTSAILSWEDPNHANGDDTSVYLYDLRISKDKVNWNNYEIIWYQRVKISQLSSGTTYFAQIRGSNGEEWSDYSPETSFDTLTH